MPTHPIYGNFLATFTPMVGVSIGLPNPISGGLIDPAGMISSYNPHFFVDASSSMLGVLESTSLDLDPSNASSLDIITATRAGTATYTDADGNIQLADPNTVRVDHVQGEQLTLTKFQNVGYTDFSSGWGGSASSQAGDGYLGSASRVVSFNGFGLYNHTVTTDNTKTYTASIYLRIKSGDASLIRLFHQLQSGSSGSNSVISATTDWQRFDVTLSSTGTSVNFGVAVFSGGSAEVEIAMPQFEEGTTASDFVENTTGIKKLIATATYAPRVPMMLIEPAATNTITYSEDTAGYNYSSGITQETTTILAPDGQASAFKITPDGSNTSTIRSGAGFQASGSYNSGDVVTTSVWLKTDGYDYLIRVGGFFGNEAALFDTIDGSNISNQSNVISASSEDYGNGWYKYKVTYTFQDTIGNNALYSGVRLYKRDASGNPIAWDATGETSGILVYGTQFELGSVATSYIPTDGDVSGVTRAADNLDITGSDFTNFYNTSEGTFYVEFTPKDITTGEQYLLRGGDSNRRIIYSNGGLSNIRSYDGTNVLNINVLNGVTNSVENNVFQRVAISFDSTTMKGSFNGGTEVTTTHNGNLLTSTILEVGANYIGHIKRILYWPLHSDNI